MSKRIILVSVLLAMTVGLAGVSNSAIGTSEVTAFLYEGSSYVPLKSTASLLGAPLRWDAEKGQAVVTYNGEDFVLTPNSLKASHAGQPVVLSSPPVVLNGVTYVPAETFKKYYKVPVEWDRARSEVKVKGPDGWATMKASSRAPWHGGPPPWAPAWGQRGYATPGHPGGTKPAGSGRANAVGQRGNSAPGHPGVAKPSGNEKAKGNSKGR